MSRGKLGTVVGINSKGHSATAKVCDIGHGGSWQEVVVATAASRSEHVLRVIDVSLIRQRGGTAAITIIFPCMGCALRSWCQPGCHPLAPQELRHIAWSMLLGIAHLHSHGFVHSEINQTRCFSRD